MEFYRLDEKIQGLVNKSKQTGVPYSILKKSYDRGMKHMENWTQTRHYSTTVGNGKRNSMLTGVRQIQTYNLKQGLQRKQRRHQKSQKSLVVFKSGLNQIRQEHLIS